MANYLAVYQRQAAVDYAHRWAYERNPAFYDYENLGGDCTNFISQCLYAGGGVMNDTPTFGWYYINANDKAPAWTGVEYLYNFLTREQPTLGPAAQEVGMDGLEVGDLIQLSFDGVSFRHTPIVVQIGAVPSPANILVAAHSFDTDYRPLNTYNCRAIRYLHIRGVWRSA